MRKNYLIAAFEKTTERRFPQQAAALQKAMCQRLDALREDYAGASQELWEHLEGQIMPGIAVYETLQTVVPKDEALQLVHRYVEDRGIRFHAMLRTILRIPGLYRKLPSVFAKFTHKSFGPTAGFTEVTHEASHDRFRFDMTRCPYHDACVKYGCPELCRCFCDSDDVTYDGLHPGLRWRRTQTLGRGGDCCDFEIALREEVL